MKYTEIQWKSFREEPKTGMELMVNCTIRITEEVHYVGGITDETVLTVEGEMAPPDGSDKPISLPPRELAADVFLQMNWIVKAWGVRVIVMPISGVKDDLRTMIQENSTPVVRTIYRQTGWTKIGGKPVYLHAGGGIGAKGNDDSISVQLPPELMRYNLDCDYEPADSVHASLGLLDVAEKNLTWPLLAATLSPLYGPCDFALHLTGRTGSFKSELVSLFQAHYGAGFDARTLPGSWSSTPNALEALAFMACNAPFTIDDFVPGGTSWQQRQYQANADKIIRSQGNQSGRARLTDASSMQQTMYPRGVILSTGEDTPEGHSVRARMLICEIAPGDIETPDLTAAQEKRAYYCGTTAFLAQSLAKTPANITPRVNAIRAQQRSIGHSRTPGMLGRLIAVAEDALQRWADAELITQTEANGRKVEATKAILAAGSQQQSYLEEQDPVDMFTAAIKQALAGGQGHIRSKNGGVPRKAEMLGWTTERSLGEMSTYKARGACIGWCSWPQNELYICVTVGFPVIKKVAGNDLALSKQTLFKRMKDASKLSRVNEAQNRNTVRVVAENHPRQVLCLCLTDFLELEDMTDEDEQPAAEPDQPDDTSGSEPDWLEEEG